MTDSDRPGPPVRVEVTAKFIEENRAKQRAYEERRRLWTEPLQPLRPRAQAAAASRGRGKINDPRQHRFDF
jgi:hypothetical protein